MRRGDKGPAVSGLQRSLIDLGYPLPRFGVDGELGSETLRALSVFLRDHADVVDEDLNEVSDHELELVRNAAAPIPLPVPSGRFFDLRDQSSRRWDEGPRSWSSVRGIGLHQTACNLGESPERMLGIGAHIVISHRLARVFLLHDFDRRVVHGNGLNTQCIGIECDGLYHGVEGRPSTLWDDKSTAAVESATPWSDLQADTCRRVIRWCSQRVAARGGKLHAILPHRVAHANRQNDPGERWWKEVGIPMRDELGLTDGGPGFKLEDGRGGRAIPEEWDPSRTGIRY